MNTARSRKAILATSLLVAGVLNACADGDPAAVLQPDGGPLMHETPGTYAGALLACMDASSPSATYTFNLGYSAPSAFSGFVMGDAANTANGDYAFSLVPGECREVWHKHEYASWPEDPVSTMAVTQTNQPTGTSFNAIALLAGDLASFTSDNATKTAIATANFWHGGKIGISNNHHVIHGQGCTPGYWKNTRRDWPITKSTDFDAFFGVDMFDPDVTLWTAVGTGGGGLNALARHATAAALNAQSGFYPMDVAAVQTAVQAVASGDADIEGAKNQLEANNELGCPLSNR